MYLCEMPFILFTIFCTAHLLHQQISIFSIMQQNSNQFQEDSETFRFQYPNCNNIYASHSYSNMTMPQNQAFIPQFQYSQFQNPQFQYPQYPQFQYPQFHYPQFQYPQFQNHQFQNVQNKISPESNLPMSTTQLPLNITQNTLLSQHNTPLHNNIIYPENMSNIIIPPQCSSNVETYRSDFVTTQSVTSKIPVPKLQNIVATANLNCKLNLRDIALRSHCCEYNPCRFSGIIMKIFKIKATCLIFVSGKIVCTGPKDEKSSKMATRKFARIIQKLGYKVIHKFIFYISFIFLNIKI